MLTHTKARKLYLNGFSSDSYAVRQLMLYKIEENFRYDLAKTLITLYDLLIACNYTKYTHAHIKL